jgi:hypothetical protein
MRKIAGKRQTSEIAGKILPSRFQKQHGLSITLVSEFLASKAEVINQV